MAGLSEDENNNAAHREMKVWIILAAFIGWTLGVWWLADTHGFNRCEVAVQDATIDAAVAARKQERKKQEEVNDTLQTQADEMATINARLVNDIKRLHQRESRRYLPPGPGANCAHAGRKIFLDRNGEDLVRLAGRADKLRSALKACYLFADVVAGQP